MADTTEQRQRELVLAPNEFAYISDQTKGNVDVYVGPHKTSLAVTDQPVIFDANLKRFVNTALQLAIQTTKIAPEGWYLVLKNPAKNGPPKPGSRQGMPDLEQGRKINVPGPVAFSLWPGQMAKVLRGHHIRSNQYLLARVYDETAARENWKESVVIPKTTETSAETTPAASEPTALRLEAASLTTGKLLIIKGTDVSFYIPPTGIEVVPDEGGKLERDAVTLERLEYCLLLNENGEKRYVQGPAVVFPEPTEVFVQREKKDSEGNPTGEKTRKFRAIELSPTSGIYIKVIADYEDDDGEHKLGDELFITGTETAIYYPREEHAIIKYGDQEVHFATAIPEGEARYVMDRNTSNIRLVVGPTMFLPDPRKEVITRRVLDAKTCELLYPNNAEALAYNLALGGAPNPSRPGAAAAAVGAAAMDMAFAEQGRYAYGAGSGEVFGAAALNFVSNTAEARGIRRERVAKGFTGDGFDRKNNYTEPRTVVLNTKYAGAVTTTIWTGFAMMLVRKSGERRVVLGPRTVHLEYDENPQLLELSTGKPKTTDNLYKTVFLRVNANKVSDVIEVETRDFVKVAVKVSYRANFEGDPNKWFDVDNYVKFMCDHLRSRVRSHVRRLTVEEFYLNSETILRDTILGPAKTDGGKREGTHFEENGMHVYDVEILGVEIRDAAVQKLLVDSQRESINHHLALQNARRNLDFTKESEVIKQEKAAAEWATRQRNLLLREEELARSTALSVAEIQAHQQTQTEQFRVALEKEQNDNQVHELKLARTRASDAQRIETLTKESQLRINELVADVEAHIKRAGAITPGLVEALGAFGERAMVEKVATAMAPLSIIGGGKRSVMEIVAEMLKGTALAKQLPTVTANGNGRQEHQATA